MALSILQAMAWVQLRWRVICAIIAFMLLQETFCCGGITLCVLLRRIDPAGRLKR
ncbi:hypothetical protein MJ699_01785 [Klebsiella pneumoniae]|nr:hypothetical protein MJ699_01785 [Klebsiella pneumoniae]